MVKSRFSHLKFLLIYLLAILLLYYPVFNTYFSQDDFFHFTVSQTDGSVTQFLNFFGFHSFDERKIAFYRPIFREVSYNIYYELFNLNSYPFRVFQFIIHFANIFLVYQLIKSIYKDRLLAFFVSFFFGISSANVGVLYYLAGGIQASGATFFILLSSVFYWKYLIYTHYQYKIIAFIFFILGLASHELAISTPLIFILLTLKYYQKMDINILKKIFINLFPLIFLVMIYLYLEFFLIGFSKDETQYQLVLSIRKSLNTFVWYIGWAIGIPEMLIDFVSPGLKIKSDIFRYWNNYYLVIISCFLGSIWILGLNFCYLSINKTFKKLMLNEFLIFFSFFIFLLPVILLPLHKSTYYLSPALPLFWLGVGLIITQSYYKYALTNYESSQKIFVITFFVLFILSMTSAKLGETTYWAASRGKVSKKLITEVKQNYPNLPKGSIIYFKNDPNYPFVAQDWGGSSKQAYFALNNQDGLRLLYKDRNLRVFYEDINRPKDKDYLKNIYQITAKIN